MQAQDPGARGGATITLLTDFGTSDIYVGVMRGVIAGIAPHARVVDLTHEVPPQDVGRAGFLLASAAPFFPSGTIHVAVVDPGVGSTRKVLCAVTGRAVYLAPDNGLLERALAIDPPRALISVEEPAWFLPRVSSTFHGRDVFAPVAAHLAGGLDPTRLGPPLSEPQRLAGPAAGAPRAGELLTRVVHVDRFGNLITELPTAALPPVRAARLRGREVPGPVLRTYAERAPGSLVLIGGSSGTLELSLTMGSAARELGAVPGDEVEVALEGSREA